MWKENLLKTQKEKVIHLSCGKPFLFPQLPVDKNALPL